ncbi:MAG: hypothetical protein ACT4O2_00150 [Beijerinckiaceae bacterium]
MALAAGANIALTYDAASRITGRAETGFPAESFAYTAGPRRPTRTMRTATD